MSRTNNCEEEPLLVAINNAGAVQDNSNRSPVRKKYRLIIIEPIIFLYTAAEIGLIPITQQYLYSRFGNMSYLQNTSQCAGNTTNPHQKEIDYMQEQTAKWSQNTEIAYSIATLILLPILGTYADTVGRRITLLVPCLFVVLQSVLLSAVIYFDLPIYCLFIVKFLQGVGSWEITLMSIYIILSDTTKPRDRALRMTIAQGIYIASSAGSEAVVGYWIQETGYFYPSIGMAALLLINLVYIYFLVPETLEPEEVSTDSSSRYACSCWIVQRIRSFTVILRHNENGRRTKIILLNVLAFISVFPTNAYISLIILLAMDTPLCWGPLKIGIYQAVYALVLPVMSIPGIKIFNLCLSEILTASIGIMSNLASFMVMYLITASWGMYLACVVNGLSMMTVAIYRAMLSNIVEPNERGKAFGLFALMEAVCGLVASPSLNAVYRLTVSYANRTVFLVDFCIVFSALLFIIFYVCYDRRTRGRGQPPISS